MDELKNKISFNKKYIFLLVNIFMIVIFSLNFKFGLIFTKFEIISIIILFTYIINLFGGQAIIFLIYFIKNDYKDDMQILSILLISDFIHILLFGSGTTYYMLLFALNHLFGFALACSIKYIHSKIKRK